MRCVPGPAGSGVATLSDGPGPSAVPTLVGAVLCGGRSSRFGSDKALALIDGVPMGRRVADALRDAGADPVVAVGGTAGPALGLPVIADRSPGEGPLGGLATVLGWAATGLVLVTPCDLPLLRGEHLSPLVTATDGGARAAVARVEGRPQPSVGCWPGAWGREVQRRFSAGERAWRSALDVGPWTAVDLAPEALLDADTRDELDRLGGDGE